jgi:hypothetical protein
VKGLQKQIYDVQRTVNRMSGTAPGTGDDVRGSTGLVSSLRLDCSKYNSLALVSGSRKKDLKKRLVDLGNDDPGNGEKLSLSKDLQSTLKLRAWNSLIYDVLTLTNGHNKSKDSGASRNYFDLLHCGPQPIEEVLVESEDELREIQESLLPTTCTDVRSYSASLRTWLIEKRFSLA